MRDSSSFLTTLKAAPSATFSSKKPRTFLHTACPPACLHKRDFRRCISPSTPRRLVVSFGLHAHRQRPTARSAAGPACRRGVSGVEAFPEWLVFELAVEFDA